MKRIFTLTTMVVAMLMFGASSMAQTTDLIISEYAEGSSNNKYIELYNGTGATIDLSNYEMWRISNGGSWPESTVSLTGMLANGEVIVIANSQADTAILNLPNATTAFNSATFFNGDDAVGLAKDNGSGTFILIDAIGEQGPDPGTGWDVAGTPNGTANHTLIRKDTVCSPDTNWAVNAGTTVANSQWIVMPQDDWNDAGSHTSACGGTPPPTTPELGFNSTSTDVNEMDTTFMIDVELTNSNALPVSFIVNYDTANSTATNGVDVDFTPVMVTIPANTDSIVSLPFTVNQDADDEGMVPEEAIIYIVGAVNADLTDSVHTVSIMDDDYVIPTYDIATVRSVDSNYVLDSLDVYCKLEGVVYGVNLFGGGYSFTLNDGTAGINVLSFSNIGSFTVNQGDELRVIGEIGQYNGLAQIEIDSVVVLSTGNCIEYPAVTFELNEMTESAPIYMMGVQLADPSQWPTSGNNANLDVITIDGDTITMRIDKDTHIADSITSAPTGMFNLSGIGGQFDNSAPYDEGYQIFPMFASDFDTVPSMVNGVYINEVMVDNQTVVTDPEGDYDSWVEVYNSNGTDVDMTGMFVYSEGADMPYRMPRCEAAVVVPANGWAMLWADDENADGPMHLPFMLDASDDIYLFSKDGIMIDSLGWDSTLADVSLGHKEDGNMDYVSFSTSTPNASNNGGIVLSVINALAVNPLNVYPNPVTTGKVNFNKVIDVKVYSLTGQLVMNRTNVKSINVSNLDKGVYLVETNEGEIVKLIVE